ncbi:MAG: hypothetical protein FWG91_04120 [Lachnospiraceae bacterium]|nr:hypothetical protein [Lachnospiraceae bacterium]
MDCKKGKWAKEILELQHDNGSWGKVFHTLSNPTSKQPLTTEQALRRLEILGFTIEDKPIKKAVKYMNDCLIGKDNIPDPKEKTHRPWNKYVELMLSTWIRVFTTDNEIANNIARDWSGIINNAFANGYYDHNLYVSKFEDFLGMKINPKAPRWNDFASFYTVSLLTNELDRKIESQYFKYILEHGAGIYYVYPNKLSEVPSVFCSKQTTYYLRAIELLAKYSNPECKNQLKFVVKWLRDNMKINKEWDLGKDSKDGILFPLSDSWKFDENRIKDCTYRIKTLLEKI